MIKLKYFSIISILLIISLVSQAYGAEGVIGEQELFVKGNKWDFKNQENTIIIVGNVKAKSPDFILWCEHLTVIYNELKNSSEQGVSNQKLEEVHAKENVIIDLNNGYTTTSDKADYSKSDQKIILTGNATVRSPTNQVSGCIITYDLVSESHTVESCPEEPVKGNIRQKIQ